MSETTLRDRVLNIVREVDTVSFGELSNRFPEFRDGCAAYCLRGNVVLWSGMTDEAIDALDALVANALIVAIPSSAKLYLYDGKRVNLPVALPGKKYKKVHWLPVVWRPFERCSPEIQKLVAQAADDAFDPAWWITDRNKND